jgi:hypothetical protein
MLKKPKIIKNTLEGYEPNFADPRVQARCFAALEFVVTRATVDVPRSISYDHIKKVFGNNDLGTWLNRKLLRCVDTFYSKDKKTAMKYVINVPNKEEIMGYISEDSQRIINKVEKAIIENREWQATKAKLEANLILTPKQTLDLAQGINHSIVDKETVDKIVATFSKKEQLQYAKAKKTRYDIHRLEFYTVETMVEITKRDYKEDFDALLFGKLKYSTSHYRMWNKLQNIRKTAKIQTLASMGLNDNYDIQCAAPTLLTQYAQELYSEKFPDKTVDFPAIENYIQNRTEIRKQVSKDTNIDLDTTKRLITMIFSGGKIGCSPHFKSFEMVGYDSVRMVAFSKHPEIVKIKNEVSSMWKIISPTMKRSYTTDKNGKKRKLSVTAREKWDIYFRLESEVLKACNDFLMVDLKNVRSIKVLLEHDGFTTSQEINLPALEEYVTTNTGYKCTFEHKHIVYDPTLRVDSNGNVILPTNDDIVDTNSVSNIALVDDSIDGMDITSTINSYLDSLDNSFIISPSDAPTVQIKSLVIDSFTDYVEFIDSKVSVQQNYKNLHSIMEGNTTLNQCSVEVPECFDRVLKFNQNDASGPPDRGKVVEIVVQ